MLIPVKLLDKYWNVKPTGVLHVGAHEAEELEQYEEFGWRPVLWVEAQPDKVAILREKFLGTSHRIVESAVWDQPGVALTLKVTSMSQSTSLFSLGTHKDKYPSILVDHEIDVITDTLDQITGDSLFEFIALDIQGAELRALQGFTKGLTHLKWIYTEVNKETLYEGCCLVEELDSYLSGFGFVRAATRWTTDSWGDALYISRTELEKLKKSQIIGWRVLTLRHLAWRYFFGILLETKRFLIRSGILRSKPKA
jgi:FkbM family methyltransferase